MIVSKWLYQNSCLCLPGKNNCILWLLQMVRDETPCLWTSRWNSLSTSCLGSQTASLVTISSHTEPAGENPSLSHILTVHCSMCKQETKTENGHLWFFLKYKIFLCDSLIYFSVFLYMDYWTFYKTILPVVEIDGPQGEVKYRIKDDPINLTFPPGIMKEAALQWPHGHLLGF